MGERESEWKAVLCVGREVEGGKYLVVGRKGGRDRCVCGDGEEGGRCVWW